MTDLIWLLVAPMSYQFMQHGMLASIVVGVLCAVVGCYVVLRGMAFLGDALAHAILPGVAVAYLLKGDMLVGALVAAVLAAFAIGFFSQHGQVKEDTSIGIVFAAALALGVALMSSARSYTTDLTHVLFGNVLGVGEQSLWLMGGLGALVLGLVVLLYKEFLLVSFDPMLATMLQMPVARLRQTMLVMLAVTVVVSLQTVGIGLVAAMLVTPGATAYLLTRRLPSMMLVAAAVGATSSIVGLYLSYYANVASGAAIVLVCTCFFLLAYIFAPRRGYIWVVLRGGHVNAR